MEFDKKVSCRSLLTYTCTRNLEVMHIYFYFNETSWPGCFAYTKRIIGQRAVVYNQGSAEPKGSVSASQG